MTCAHAHSCHHHLVGYDGRGSVDEGLVQHGLSHVRCMRCDVNAVCVWMCVWMDVCMYAMYGWMYACYVWMDVCMYVCMYACMYVCYVCMQLFVGRSPPSQPPPSTWSPHHAPPPHLTHHRITHRTCAGITSFTRLSHTGMVRHMCMDVHP